MQKSNNKYLLFIVVVILSLLSYFCYKYCCVNVNVHETFFYNLKEADRMTKRLKISLTTLKDVDKLSDYLMDKEVCTVLIPSLYNSDGFISKEAAKRYIERELAACNDIYMFTISRLENGIYEPIGQISFSCNTKSVLWIAYWLGKKFHKKGYMSEIVPLIKKYFDKCNDLTHMHIQCLYTNVGSAKICSRICALFDKESDKYTVEYNLSSENQSICLKTFDIYKKNKDLFFL